MADKIDCFYCGDVITKSDQVKIAVGITTKKTRQVYYKRVYFHEECFYLHTVCSVLKDLNPTDLANIRSGRAKVELEISGIRAHDKGVKNL